jgi:thiamine biosynthesis protein ThiS
MQAIINGEAQTLPGISTVAELMDALGLSARKVAIEVNLAIVPRSLYAETRLCEGDKIEIVQFIGGG